MMTNTSISMSHIFIDDAKMDYLGNVSQKNKYPRYCFIVMNQTMEVILPRSRRSKKFYKEVFGDL